MKDWLAVAQGRWVPHAEASVPLSDAGFVLGATVTEQLRTFGGKLFLLEAHLARLRRSAEAVGLAEEIAWEDLADQARRLTAHNYRTLPAGEELGLAVLVTPGHYAAFETPASPVHLYLHTYRLPVERWSGLYRTGAKLRIAPHRQVPAECWPPHVKCRSRMHYHLADRWAAAQEPGARAILLQLDGMVAETATANLLVVRRLYDSTPPAAADAPVYAELWTPPRSTILPGISLDHTLQLAGDLGLRIREAPLPPEALAGADEVWLTSTPSAILPVASIDGRLLGDGTFPVFRTMLAAWRRSVGIDFASNDRIMTSTPPSPR